MNIHEMYIMGYINYETWEKYIDAKLIFEDIKNNTYKQEE